MITFSANWVQMLGVVIGVVLPLLVGIITTRTTNPAIKGTLLAALAFVTNILTGIETALQHHTSFDLGAALILGLGTFIVAVASYFGFWAPTKVTAFLQEKVGRTSKPVETIPHEGKHIL